MSEQNEACARLPNCCRSAISVLCWPHRRHLRGAITCARRRSRPGRHESGPFRLSWLASNVLRDLLWARLARVPVSTVVSGGRVAPVDQRCPAFSGRGVVSVVAFRGRSRHGGRGMEVFLHRPCRDLYSSGRLSGRGGARHLSGSTPWPRRRLSGLRRPARDRRWRKRCHEALDRRATLRPRPAGADGRMDPGEPRPSQQPAE